jgi:hypothetical protein
MNVAKKGSSTSDEPAWIDPSNDRKTPYTDEELEQFVTDFVANMADVQAWNDLIKDVGETKARQILKEQFMARDDKNLVNWDPDSSAH